MHRASLYGRCRSSLRCVLARGCVIATCAGVLSLHWQTQDKAAYLAVGTLVYARVELASKHMDTELTCMADSGIKKDWMTGEAQFGKLVGGTTFECSHELARSLLQEDCPVLIALARYIKFEIAIGYNGWVWIDSQSPQHSIVVANACLNSEFMKKSDILPMVEELIAAML